MKILNRFLIVVFTLTVIVIGLAQPTDVDAATSPTLTELSLYSVLGGAEVTCTGATTTTGIVGVSPGTSITGFPSPCTAGGGTQSNTASAITAQAETVATYTALDQACDQTFGAVDLTATFPSGVGPGVYCSTSSFSLSGNLTLTGSGVHIFKTVSTLITSSGSSVTGGDPCNVWWRVGSAATLGSSTAFIGNIVTANVADTTALNSGATLNGRVLAQAGATVTLNANTISGPSCAGGSSSSSSSGPSACPALTYTEPIIIESRRIDADSILFSWGQFLGIDTFNVQYGLTDGEWLNSVDVTGSSITINNLPPNQPIWVRVATRSDCTVGVYSASMLVGGAISSRGSFLIPRLPNAGISPGKQDTSWSHQAGINLIFSNFFKTLSNKF